VCGSVYQTDVPPDLQVEMLADENVSVRALKARLTRTRRARALGTLATPYQFKRCRQPEYTTQRLLVSKSWLREALKVRALELEHKIVSAIGVMDETNRM